MEALEFLKEAKRKCSSTTCEVCHNESYAVLCPLSEYPDEKLEKLVSGIEQWSEEHPIITNAMKFKEVFGYSGDIVAKVKPERIPPHSGSCGYDKCTESCGSRCFPRCPMWWNDEFKEPEHENE